MIELLTFSVFILLAFSFFSSPTPLLGDYIPTIFDNYNQNVLVDGKLESLSLWDSAGQEDYDRLRPLCYPGTDVFLVCYSMTSPSSLNNLRNKWIDEIRMNCGKNVPIVLVGTKSDAREDAEIVHKLHQRGLDPVSYEEGQQFAKECGAAAFVECSSKTQHNVTEVFEQAVIAGRQARNNAIARERKAKRSIVGRIMGLMGMVR
jgi:small GTP-binding protein